MNPEERLRALRDPDRWEHVRTPRPAARPAGRLRTPPARIAQLIAAFAIAVVVVAGLAVGLATLRGPVPPAATPTPTTSTSLPVAVPPAVPTTFSLVPGATHVYSDSVLPPACTLAQLRTESKQDGGDAAGSYIQALFVLNTGPDCLLRNDVVRVGGRVASSAASGASRGVVLPSLAPGQVMVTTAEACLPTMTTSNIGDGKPVEPIVLDVGGRTRTMTARFPRTTCERPFADAGLADADSAPIAQSALEATVAQPAKTPGGTLRYQVAVQTTGSSALTLSTCPVATEVLQRDGGATVITRAFALRCTVGATLEPDVPVTVPVTTTIPTSGDWTISWYLGGGAGTAERSSTCTLAQLGVAEPGPGGASTGDWVQLVTVRNHGVACTLPVTAFGVGGRVARAGRSGDAAGFALAARSTTVISVLASNTCADGSANVTSVRSLGPNAKPVTLQLGGRLATGLDEPFPQLHCAGPFVDRVG